MLKTEIHQALVKGISPNVWHSLFGHLFFVVLVGAVSCFAESHEPLSQEQQLEERYPFNIEPKYFGHRVASCHSKPFQKLKIVIPLSHYYCAMALFSCS